MLIVLVQAGSVIATEQLINDNLRHTKTYYWLGIADKGDPKTIAMGLHYLEKANTAFIAIESELDEKIAQNYRESIRLMRTDLNEQLAVASNNFAGRFPLARFIGETPLLRSDAYGSYEIATPPGEFASARAVKTIGAIINQGLWGDAQLPMFIFSRNDELPDMESATRALFKPWYRVKVYENAYLNTFLPIELIDTIVPQDVAGKVMNKLGSSYVAFVNIDLYDQVDGILFYRFSCNIYVSGSNDPVQSIVHYEIVRDKRYMATWFLYVSLFFMLLSCVLFYFLNLRNAEKSPGILSYFLLPVSAWMLGVVSTIATLSILSAIRPDFQEYITYSFWWPPIVFLLIFLASVVLVRKIIKMIPYLKNFKGDIEESASLYIASALGVANVLALGLMLYHTTEAIPFVVAKTYLFAVTANAFGKAMDKFNPRPMSGAIPFLLLIPFASYVIAGVQQWPVFILMLVTVLLHLFYLLHVRKNSESTDDHDYLDMNVESCGPGNINDFILSVQNPPYFETNKLKKFLSGFETLDEKKTKVVCISGKDGIGKTATAREIIRRLKKQYLVDGETDLMVMKGYGEEQTAGNSPYFAVRQMLESFFGINPFDDDAESDDIDSLLDGVFKNVVPFSGFLMPAQKKNAATLSTQEELFYSIAQTIKNVSKQKRLVFFIDDIHWLDDATTDLLIYLHEFFKNKAGLSILFLYTSRPHEKLGDVFAAEEIFEHPAFEDSDYYDFLAKVFNIEPSSSKLIIRWVSGQMAGKGNMFWLFKILELLARGGELKVKDQSFYLPDELLSHQTLPIPEEYRLTIREELTKLDRHKKIIGLAAVMGMQFDAFLIAWGLKIDKLTCLEALDMIERESNLVYDVVEKDGIFSFHSSFTLETVRMELGIFDTGKNHVNLRQIIREYNAIVASVYEEKAPQEKITQIASCYYNAGSTYAVKTIHSCLEAANHCVDVFRYNEARRFCGMAEEYMQYVDDPKSFELELAIIRIRIITSQGKILDLPEDCCKKLLREADNMTIKQLEHFAHYFYHIRNFEEGLNIADRIINLAKSPADRVIGLFWKGLNYPAKEVEKRIGYLQEALNEVALDEFLELETLKIKSHILNSLGELHISLAEGNRKYKSVAREYLLQSITIKSKPELLDRAGLARSYGGLGRLELFIEPVNPRAALDYFEKDLELAKITGDYRGQVKMYSFIGACNIKLGNYETAASSYKQSYQLSIDAVDAFFALLGLLEVYVHEVKLVDAAQVSKDLKALMQEHALPGYCIDALKSLVGKHPDVDYLKGLV